MEQKTAVTRELDERHRLAKLGCSRRDVDICREIFSPSLAYHTLDGKIVGRDQLMRHFGGKFQGLNKLRSSFFRQYLKVTDNEITETLLQRTEMQSTRIGIDRRWTVSRCATYTWTKQEGVWVVERAQVFWIRRQPQFGA